MSASFYVTTVYALISVFAYFLVCYVIIRFCKVFAGSYYSMFVVNSLVNCYTYLNSLIVLRLPAQTCEKCFFSFIFAAEYFWGLEFFNCMYGHLAYVQYLMILSFILNRFTAVVMPLKYDKIWKILFIPLMLFNVLSPFVFTYGAFLQQPRFFYINDSDTYLLAATKTVKSGNTLIPSMILLTVLSTIFMIATFAAYFNYKRDDRAAQWKLLAFSISYFLVEMFATGVMLVITLAEWNDWIPVKLFTYALLPYASDALTFISPYILIYCSPTLQKLLKRMCRRAILRKKDGVSISIF